MKFKLSFTHYTYFIRLDDEMRFYEHYAITQNLTVRQLQKVVQNNTILRVGENQKEKLLLKAISNDVKFVQSDKLKNLKEYF